MKKKKSGCVSTLNHNRLYLCVIRSLLVCSVPVGFVYVIDMVLVEFFQGSVAICYVCFFFFFFSVLGSHCSIEVYTVLFHISFKCFEPVFRF